MYEGVHIIIPVYNEASVLASVLTHVGEYVPHSQVIIINDGSSDASGTIASSFGCHVLHHRLNRGLGAALQSGFALAQHLGAQYVVTFDGDGQHNAADIPSLLAPLQSGQADMAIGSRFLQQADMPQHRRVFNMLGNVVTWGFHGAWVSDSQSGLRAFTRQTLDRLQVSANQMDVSSEFIREAHRLRLRVHEVPIQPVYTTYSLSKGQNFFEGVRTLIRIALRKSL